MKKKIFIIWVWPHSNICGPAYADEKAFNILLFYYMQILELTKAKNKMYRYIYYLLKRL